MANQNSANQSSSEQFEKAGAQAAEVLGRFVNFAAELGREFGNGQNDQQTSRTADASSKKTGTTGTTGDAEEIIREVGERLRELRETAGYTIDGFANALEKELNAAPVAKTIDAVEAGRQAPPGEWVQAISTLLGSNEVKKLFEQLGVSAANTEPADATVKRSPTASRVGRLSAVFSDDQSLDALSDDEFEKLVEFMNSSYRQARVMISK